MMLRGFGKVDLYDVTLRDGAQAEDISFTVEDKLRISEKLDEIGIAYLEGGWPGSNPKDDEFFKRARQLRLKRTKLVAFGSTCRRGSPASQDKGLASLVAAGAPVITIFGKTWDLHVEEALHASLDENLDLIADSIRHLKKQVAEVIFDAEHFFDGYKNNPTYALKGIAAAESAGVDVIVLCDTNGGSLPSEIFGITTEVRKKVGVPIGIHAHNDGEVAVANSLEAVRAGATQIHGTINGIGERCGNANLVSIIPDLTLKMHCEAVTGEQLRRLREVSRFVDELANRKPSRHQPFVGDSAFAHKGGVHVSAVMKKTATYEHIDPAQVGNRRRILISDQAGASSILAKAKEFGLSLEKDDAVVRQIVRELKDLENKGFEFEGAEASFELLMRRAVEKKGGRHAPFFRLIGFRAVDEQKKGGRHARSHATIEIEVGGKREKSSADGKGPVNALDLALRKALGRFYPELKEVQLLDYKVRVLPAGKGTASQVRVLIESADRHDKWGTVGVSENIIQASWMALVDALEFKLVKGERRQP